MNRFKRKHIFWRKKYLLLLLFYLSIAAFGLAMFPVPPDYQWGIASAIVTTTLGVFWLFCLVKFILLFKRKMRVILSGFLVLYMALTMMVVSLGVEVGRIDCAGGKILVSAKARKKYDGQLRGSEEVVVYMSDCMPIGMVGNVLTLNLKWYNDQHQLILERTPIATVHNFFSMLPLAWVFIIFLDKESVRYLW